ncbi:MAG: hypothetical protein JXX14_11435 [Deltaproteobacteria bacterium]|nr:hypothetical protein [Deltaproteobacteria bacterium]
MPRNIITYIILTLMLMGSGVHAAKVYLNGVDITQVTEKTFKNVTTVRIDDKGDIHIEAPHYEVKVLEAGSESANSTVTGESNEAGLTEKYFIASQGPAPKVQYELAIVINGVTRIIIPATKSSVIREITGWLQKGKNTIQITATKKMGVEGRVSTLKSDEVSVLIGSGHEEKKIVKIDSLKATFKCNAASTNTFTREYTITAR